jgi:hypothetical protein
MAELSLLVAKYYETENWIRFDWDDGAAASVLV